MGGCNLKSPTVAEQRALASKGAFGNTNPAWTAMPLPRVGDAAGYTGGVPDYTLASTHLNPLSDGLNADERPAMVNTPDETPPPAPAAQEEKSDSPLVRIERSCPGTEKEVSQALQTVVRSERIKKYELLTGRCAVSSELWTWLGVDYQRSGNLDEAKRAFEQAVVLNPSNDEAKGYLAQIQRKIAESMRKK